MKANIVVKTKKNGSHITYSFITNEKYENDDELLKIIDDEIKEVEDDVWNLNRVYRVLIAKRKDLVELKELRKLIAERQAKQKMSSETPEPDDK